MILSTLGVDNTAAGVQHVFQESIENWNGPWEHGNPVGVAVTINRYNVGRSADGKQSLRPGVEYMMKRAATPYAACATLVNALHDYAAASIVMVFGSMHWMVIFGGSGDGEPVGESSYTIDGLWVVNPDNGLFRDDKLNAGKPGFAREHVTYESFLYDYFDGGNDGKTTSKPGGQRWGYGDGGEFIVVTHADAEPRGRLALPIAEDALRPPMPIDAAVVQWVLANPVPQLLGAQQRKTRKVRRIDRGDESFFIVPFVKDNKVHVLRFDENGIYRGTAFDMPDEGQFDDRPTGLVVASEKLDLKLSDADMVNVPLVWAPTEESGSPYKPFYALKTKEGNEYASLSGGIAEFDDPTKQAFDAQVV